MRVSREYKLGLLVIIGTFTIIVAISFLKSGVIFSKNNEYYAVFDNATGLDVGNEVQLNGVKIGEVLEVGLHPKNPTLVLTKFNIENENLEIPRSSQAWLISVDVLSTKCIDLRLDLSDSASAELLADGDTLKSQKETTLDQDFKMQFEPIKNKAEVLTKRVQDIIVEVNEMWDSSASYTFEESVYKAREAIGTYKQLVKNLIDLINGKTQMVTSIVTNVNTIKDSIMNKMSTINVVASKITDINSHVNNSGVLVAVASISNSMTEINALILKINAGNGTFGALTKKPDFQDAIKDTQKSLNALLASLTKDPMYYVTMSLFGKKVEGLKLTKEEEEKLKEWLSR